MARLALCLLALLCLLRSTAHADPARFDLLAGVQVEVRVTRAGVTLPIASVPNLQAGDQLWLHPAFPASQQAHYLLIVAFLRGTTNPPPDHWFTRVETWTRKPREEGVLVTVPEGAQQAVLFLAPETGGDFATLRSAVQGRPGIFVRAVQDLTEAGFEQARIDTYLDSMKMVAPTDQAGLIEHSNLLARTLNLRPNPECFKRELAQQYNCLIQTGTQTLLDDGHGQSLVAALSTGPGSDFINAASTTQLAGGGTYSAYVGAIVDFVRIVNNLHTAQYQYIPALATPDREALNLKLNTAPSFHNPKSVIVIGLPAVQAATPPPLRPADPKHVSCLLDPHLVLPVEGAPLVFSTAFAHQLVLHLAAPGPDGTLYLPLTPAPYRGGLMLATPVPARPGLPLAQPLPHLGDRRASPAAGPPVQSPGPGRELDGVIEGLWGFDRFAGPTLRLQAAPGKDWRLVSSAAPGVPTELIAGTANQLQITSSGTACVENVGLEPGNTQVAWKLQPTESPAAVAISLTPSQAAHPGSMRLLIRQFGQTQPDRLDLHVFSPLAQLEALQIHAGDTFAVLRGTALSQVRSLTLKDATFVPLGQPTDSATSLTLELADGSKAPPLKAGEKVEASVALEDGRRLTVAASVLPARPVVALLSMQSQVAVPSALQLGSANDVPLGAQLVFVLRSKTGFARSEHIEIAQSEPEPGEGAPEEPLHTSLSIAAGSLILEDAHTVLATFDPLKSFGPSTFGAFRMRAVAADGTEGLWLPLARIVRLPVLSGLACPVDPALPCTLSGTALYLIASVSVDAGFASPQTLPDGFVETTLSIPRPTNGTVYLKLRDDPSTIQQIVLPMRVLAPSSRVGSPGLR